MTIKSLGATIAVLILALAGAYAMNLTGKIFYQGDIEVKELGFKISVPANLRSEIQYKIVNAEGIPVPFAQFYSTQGDCDLGAVSRGQLASTNADLEFFGACMDGGRCIKQFDGFSLSYSGPQAVSCGSEYADIERKTRQAVQDGFKNVELIRQ